MVGDKAASTGAVDLTVAAGEALGLFARAMSAAATCGAGSVVATAAAGADGSVKLNTDTDLFGAAITAEFITGVTVCAAACAAATALLTDELLLTGDVALPPLLVALPFPLPLTFPLLSVGLELELELELAEFVAGLIVSVPFTKLMKS